MPNSTSGLVTNGVTITQVHANAGTATDERFGATLDIDGDIDGEGSATAADQFVSFVNTTDAPVDISGYQVWSTTQLGGDTNVYPYHTFAPGTVLQPGEVIYIVTEYTGDLSLRDETIVDANGAVATDASSLIRTNSDGEFALVDPTAGNYIHFTFDLTPANLATQPNQPERELEASPQHRVLVRSKIAEDMAEVTYWHFLFEAHQVVFSNGAATESLFTGPVALKAVSRNPCPAIIRPNRGHLAGVNSRGKYKRAFFGNFIQAPVVSTQSNLSALRKTGCRRP